MPIEELLAMYNCVTPPVQTFTPSGSGSKRRSKTSRNAGLDKTLMPPPETPKTIAETSTSNERVKDDVTSEDAATAETDNKPNTNTESAETAAAAAATSPSTSSTTETTIATDTTQTTIQPDENADKESDSIDTAESKIEDVDNNAVTADHSDDTTAVTNKDPPEEIDTSQMTSKTSDIQEESTESNTSDKENNAKDDNNPNSDATDSAHANSPSTKASVDVESNKSKGNCFVLFTQDTNVK